MIFTFVNNVNLLIFIECFCYGQLIAFYFERRKDYLLGLENRRIVWYDYCVTRNHTHPYLPRRWVFVFRQKRTSLLHLLGRMKVLCDNK
jgi:hypothetical protein